MNPPSCSCTVGRDEQGKSSPAVLAYRLRVTPSADLDVWRGEKAWKYATFSSGLYLFIYLIIFIYLIFGSAGSLVFLVLFSGCGEGGYSPVGVLGLLFAVASLVAGHGLF